jgi:selenocysteine lyase/cysteine desulfurase
MELDRRRLLTSLVAGLAAGPLAGVARGDSTATAVPAARPPLVGADGRVDWRAVRGEFDLDPAWIHLASFFFASHPRPVREAIERYRRRFDADPLWLDDFQSPDAPAARLAGIKRALAAYLGGRPEEIALMPNTTTGLALVWNGLRISPGQEIVTSEHDHFSHHESIRYAAARHGAPVRFVALYDRGEAARTEEIVDRLRRALTPKTRAVGLTWVHSSTGVKLPIAELAAAVADANRGRDPRDRCLLVVDGVHGFGNQDVDAAGLGADFFAAGTHKWMLAPRGTGLLWGRADAWPEIAPTVPSFEPTDFEPWAAWMERRDLPPTRAAFVSPGGFLAYEHLLAVGEAVELHRTLGRAAIAGRIAGLNDRIRRGLTAIAGVTLHTPLDPRLAAGINCFEVAGRKPEEVVERLAERRIRASVSPYAVAYARLAAGIMNSSEEIDTALAAVREIAGRG